MQKNNLIVKLRLKKKGIDNVTEKKNENEKIECFFLQKEKQYYNLQFIEDMNNYNVQKNKI